jgi:hypothetical protein
MIDTDINIESLILVAIWENPAIFQGCFKISALNFNQEAFFFFRYQCQETQTTICEQDFSPDHYHLTHLFHQTQAISLHPIDEAQEHALYLFKYALYTTLKEMLLKQAQKSPFLFIDDVVLESLIEKVKPILDKDSLWGEQMQEIGFAVAMDFRPREPMGKAAVHALLSGLKSDDMINKKIH